MRRASGFETNSSSHRPKSSAADGKGKQLCSARMLRVPGKKRRVQAAGTAALALVLVLAFTVGSFAHVERASYWPDPAPDCSISPCAGGTVPVARSLASALPAVAPKKCSSRRQVMIALRGPHGERLHSVSVKASGGRVHSVRGGQPRARVDLRGLGAGTFKVRMTGRTASGRKVTRTYSFRTCTKKKAAHRAGARATPPSVTRVVCQADSLQRAEKSIAGAMADGVRVRPSQPLDKLSTADGQQLLALNQGFAKACKFHEIQPAVTASGNNDRVVIMPGVYTEPTARAAKTHDPACAKYDINNDRGQSGAVSYAHQFYCPNDANLIAVIGRGLGTGKDPQPPLEDRRNIPNRGPCIRCNLQMEGSGAGPDDVVIDAGRVESGDHGPIGAVKDVGVRADRADGFVLRNVTVRHAGEHGIYVLESNGFLLDRFRSLYHGEYGVLTFVEDYGLISNCDAAGNGDSGLYPGASAEKGDQRPPGVAAGYSEELRNCDMHHNAGGYSGTDGNSVKVDHNNFYDNALGFTTDVFTAAGHPGFPQDSDLIEDNNFYSNNFNPYLKGSDVTPVIPVPVGTGLWIAGGNHNIVRNNHFWDNWRRGTMLFAVPDALVCTPPDKLAGCDPAKLSTSHNNRFYGNVMGIAPDGSRHPNGTDFWWDSFTGNMGNCWYDNGAVTSVPPGALLPGCNGGKDPSTSIGVGGPAQEAELLGCFGAVSGGGYDPTGCPWFVTPPKPG